MQALEDEGHHHDPVTKVKRAINAIRATMRAATGVSLTAMYVSFVAFTSGLVRGTMSFILAWFPTWVSEEDAQDFASPKDAYRSLAHMLMNNKEAIFRF